MKKPDRARIVFLFSDTGGGHRSAASAIIEALELEYPGQVETEMIDIFRDYGPPLLDIVPDIYLPLSKVPDVWELGYKASDSPRRTRFIHDAVWPYIRVSVHRLVQENPADLIVSVHPLINTPILRTLRPHTSIPYITVVTDMVSTHAFWFDRRADRIIVPTEEARQRALQVGMSPRQLEVIGLPVAQRFCQPVGDRMAIRQQLGWPEGPVILMVGGGEGMGPLEEVAHAVDDTVSGVSLAIIAGRNKQLKSKLEKKSWRNSVFIYGFVKEMPDFMRAADILVTKAGPGTICEAFIAGIPLILYSRMPGQEEGNVTYVVEHGAGVWAPEPQMVANVVRNYVVNPAELAHAAQASSRLARPDAARRIARRLVESIGMPVTYSVGMESSARARLRRLFETIGTPPAKD